MTPSRARFRSRRRVLGSLVAAASAVVGAVTLSPAAQAADTGHGVSARSSTAGLVMHRESFTIPAGQTTYRGSNVSITRSAKQAADTITCAITVSNPYLSGFDVEALSQAQCSQSVTEIQLYIYLYSSGSNSPTTYGYNVVANSAFVQAIAQYADFYPYWYAVAEGAAYWPVGQTLGGQALGPDYSQEVLLAP